MGENGPVVVLLHGFPDTWQTFDQQVPALVAAGFRVLVPVLPGYDSGSVDPAGRYFASGLVQWLINWLDALGEGRVHLVGHDWGAVIAWLAVVQHPGRFHSLTAIAIPSLHHLPRAVLHHPGQLLNSWYMGFFQWRGVAERALQAGDGWLIRQLWRNWSPGWEAPAAHLDAVCRQLLQPDIQQAALGYYRCLFKWWDREHRHGRSLLGLKVAVPTLMISGAQDGCMDTRLFDAALVEADFPAGIELYRLMGAGHFCHLEKPALVNHKLTQFLRHCQPAPTGTASELEGRLG